jgi:hypothetical protein
MSISWYKVHLMPGFLLVLIRPNVAFSLTWFTRADSRYGWHVKERYFVRLPVNWAFTYYFCLNAFEQHFRKTTIKFIFISVYFSHIWEPLVWQWFSHNLLFGVLTKISRFFLGGGGLIETCHIFCVQWTAAKAEYFETETDCVLCTIRAEAEETIERRAWSILKVHHWRLRCVDCKFLRVRCLPVYRI